MPASLPARVFAALERHRRRRQPQQRQKTDPIVKHGAHDIVSRAVENHDMLEQSTRKRKGNPAIGVMGQLRGAAENDGLPRRHTGACGARALPVQRSMTVGRGRRTRRAPPPRQ